MERSTLAARFADLQVRSAATDHAAAAALTDLKTAAQQLASAMDRLTDTREDT